MLKDNKKKWTSYKVLVGVFIIGLSLIETSILILLKETLEIYSENINLYIVVLPIVAIVICIWTSERIEYKLKKTEYKKSLEYLKNSFIMTTFLYLMSILIDFKINNKDFKIIFLLICLGGIFYSYQGIKSTLQNTNNKNLSYDGKNNSSLFSIYYLNISKVFEISMLINNKIVTNIQNERTTEDNESSKESLSANINSEYLKIIKNSMAFENSYTKTTSEKNRVLENFDVKTTKSNLLDSIIKKSKKYKSENKIHPGDLLMFNNVKIELLNEEETMRITKMLLNGAFNGSMISSTSNEMKMDVSVSSLINSIMGDYSYELECSVDGFTFHIKIPMSFKDDFESNYNIYDILIGKMTLIGIYRGKDKDKNYQNTFDFFNNSSNDKDNMKDKYNLGLKKSEVETQTDKEMEIASSSSEQGRHYVDIIAIIQDINI